MRVALIGFGNVGRALARLLLRQDQVLRDQYGLDWRVTAIVTARHGWMADDAGLDLVTCLDQERLGERGPAPPVASLPADVLIEVSTLNPKDGQPALGVIREALGADMHVVTANKGPIAHGYHELRDLAAARGCLLRFEATIADDLPVFNLVRYALPSARILGLRGIVNSTTNYVLSQAAAGATLTPALEEAQRLGIAERDPSLDLEGWDAAVKATILANVLLGARMRVADVERRPLDEEAWDRAREAAAHGRRVRPVLTVGREGARWAPTELAPEDHLFSVDGLSMALELETDVAGRLSVILDDPHVEQVAFALLADLVEVAATAERVDVIRPLRQ